MFDLAMGGSASSATGLSTLFDFLIELQQAMQGGELMMISFGAALTAIFALAFCFWGYKLTKVMFGILCFLLGLLLGIGIVMGTGFENPTIGGGLLLGAVLGAGLAFVSKYIYKALVFLCNAGLVVLIFILFASDATIEMMGFLGVAVGAVVGFFAVKYIRLSLILFTSIVHGLAAGSAVLLVVGIANPGAGLLLGAVLAVLGFGYQWKSTGGGSVKDYLLLRKTEAEQEKQAAQTTQAAQYAAVPSSIAAITIPGNLLGTAFFSQWKAYAAVPLFAALILPLLPLGGILTMCLAVAVSIYLSPCAGAATMLCSNLFGIVYLLPQLSRGNLPYWYSGFYCWNIVAGILFVFLVGVGCRRFPGVFRHVAVFAGAGILAGVVMVFPNLRDIRESVLGTFIVPFVLSGLCAAAFEEFAMPLIIRRVPEKFRGFFLSGEWAAEPVMAAVTVPGAAPATPDEPTLKNEPQNPKTEEIE